MLPPFLRRGHAWPRLGWIGEKMQGFDDGRPSRSAMPRRRATGPCCLQEVFAACAHSLGAMAFATPLS